MHIEIHVSPAPPDMQLVWVATFLPVKRYLDVPAFLLLTQRVSQQLRNTDGIVQFSLSAKLLRKQFWTVSVWKDRTAIDTFKVSEPHLTAMRRFSGWAAAGAATVQWTANDTAINWHAIKQRLHTSGRQMD